MTLAARIAQMVQLGHRTSAHTARQIITEVRDHDARLLDQIRVRDLPMPDCPDGCVVGAEWKRRAEHAWDQLARHEIQRELLGGARDGAELRGIEDGHGSYWERCDRPGCELHVVRPGVARCYRCEEEEHPDGAR